MKGRILLVEDDETFRSFLQTVLEDDGYNVIAADNGLAGLKLLRREQIDVVISDLNMPGKSGLELFREIMKEASPPRFIFLTAFGRVEEAVSAMKDGAFDFLTKPLEEPEALLAVVDRALKDLLHRRDYLSLKESDAAGLPPEELIFAGAAMKPVQRLVQDVAATTANVLIYGESGTGKEVVARTIHHLSPRGKAGFVALNCAAIPENLLESELFGHEKGSFTGALQTRQGKFELAGGGTIFLDEIGEMPLALQSKLLRVLQERVFERVGGSREIRADVRVIAATNRDLHEEVSRKRFREDLFYRLNVFPIRLPPLRERQDTVPLLADYFLQRFSLQIGKKLKAIEPEAMMMLKDYAWPGNIRELQNVIERAVILAADVIRCANLPEGLIMSRQVPDGGDGKQRLKQVERELIVAALQRRNGNRRLAAEDLQMSRRTLQYKLKEFGLHYDER